jgi:hypothetical protein
VATRERSQPGWPRRPGNLYETRADGSGDFDPSTLLRVVLSLSKDEGRLPGGQSGAAAARVAISGTRPAARATESARQAIEKTL